MSPTEKLLVKIADVVRKMLPTDWNFALLVFKPNEEGSTVNYISSGARENMVRALKECVGRLDENQDGAKVVNSNDAKSN